ncbi:MAG: SDR family oxidoreductase [Gammaproteobacteria bacterium]|nr:SDR family oxidoreductase [Gammaproteobacteria bacterium]MCZ6723442.1 SDR family oxidoreductase [Gammaproteobacteria bacterium]
MVNFKGKKAIIFGGTSGIGLEIAKLLRTAKAEVVTVSRRGPISDENESMQNEIADVQDRKALELLFVKHSGFDFLVNAATGGPRAVGPFLDMDLDGFQGSFAKLWGYVNSVRLGAPHMAKDGAIVLLSGYPARKPRPGALAIGTVGNAVEGFIRLAAAEIKPLRINGVCPGLIDTPMFAMEGEARENHFSSTTKDHLIPRVGKPEEVAAAAIFLLENAFVTGTIVDVDGGAILS